MKILLTGAASGIGAAVKDRLLNDGHEVWAIDIKPISPAASLHGFTADIRNGEALSDVFSQIKSNAAELDAIICAAGVHDMLSFVESEFDSFQKLIDINLIGCARVINAFYPLLKPQGRVIIVTSEVAYMTPMPFNGAYSVSKTALDCYAKALRQEVNLLNQKVVVIRPGAVATPLCEGSISSTERLSNETKLYSKQSAAFTRLTKRFMGTPISPEKAAEHICKALYAKRPRLQYSFNTNLGLRLLNLLPDRLALWIVKRMVG